MMIGQNSIVSIEGMPLASFSGIKAINLSDNFLREMRWLRKCLTKAMIHLKHLNLSNNEIIDLSWLSECHFHKLETLNLRNNKYGDFVQIEKVKMADN